ncbi:hypothetical protein SO802_002471 [Lithocarpus litseifolius]|uniref:Uncharacterized protein n=1 Tax=Lithocarpus litseifolius TaxID=425828 RepID=A0AAW2DXU5_9ROSI
MVHGFELLFNCNNKLSKLKKEDKNWAFTDWADYMDHDAMTMLLGDAICNIEEEEYREACQHALKSPYEARTSDEDEEGGEAPSDDDEGSNNKSDNSRDSGSNDRGDRKDEATVIVKETTMKTMIANIVAMIGDDVEFEPIDIENGAKSEEYGLVNVLEAAKEEVEEANNIDYDDYPYGYPSDWSCITSASSKSGPRCDKHGR